MRILLLLLIVVRLRLRQFVRLHGLRSAGHLVGVTLFGAARGAGGRCCRRGGLLGSSIVEQNALCEGEPKFCVGGLQFVAGLSVDLEAEIENGLGLLEGASRLEVACPADVEDGAFGADVALIEQLVQVQCVGL